MLPNYLKLTCFFLLVFLIAGNIKAQRIVLLQQGRPTSIRGLSVVDDSVAWVSGSKGCIGVTLNGGKNWNWQQVPGFEKADFRDVEAFSDKEAIIMSSGTPALILKTVDGGSSWQVKYRNADTTYFFDAMDFADKQHGYVLGDPINNKFVLMETMDQGETWAMVKTRPDAMPGEAAFAASGTCLRVTNQMFNIVTGGTYSRVLISPVSEMNWVNFNLFLAHGRSSQGAFSIAHGEHEIVAVGGDYAKETNKDSVAVVFSRAPHTSEIIPAKGPWGFQSCVEYISDETYLSTGTPGSNITTDGGDTWAKIGDTSFNVCRTAKHGKLVLLAGDDGKIGILKR